MSDETIVAFAVVTVDLEEPVTDLQLAALVQQVVFVSDRPFVVRHIYYDGVVVCSGQMLNQPHERILVAPSRITPHRRTFKVHSWRRGSQWPVWSAFRMHLARGSPAGARIQMQPGEQMQLAQRIPSAVSASR
jgi:hypothetical protein